MKTKISFQNMPHSDPLEAHTSKKLEKITAFIDDSLRPCHAEVWLKANKTHPHHSVEIHLKTPAFDLHAHEGGTDMYVTVDSTIDKIISLLKKEKAKKVDKQHKVDTEKKAFLRAAPRDDEEDEA